MQTVIETPAYLASAKDENVTEEERHEIVSYIASNPDAGDVMAGTGGARKLRFGGRGTGKSGGYRIITFYADAEIPVFLLQQGYTGEPFKGGSKRIAQDPDRAS